MTSTLLLYLLIMQFRSTIVTYNFQDKSQSSGRGSPSLDDLEEKKRLLLNALEDGTPNSSIISILDTTEEIIEDKSIEATGENMDITNDVQENVEDSKEENVKPDAESNENIADNHDQETKSEETQNDEETNSEETLNDVKSTEENPGESTPEPSSSNIVEISDTDIKIKDSVPDVLGTPESKPGHVKGTLYGTPVINVASPYVKLPTDDKFAKDICDVINFENLPNSTGKYKKISVLLRKVKSEVDRIQDS